MLYDSSIRRIAAVGGEDPLAAAFLLVYGDGGWICHKSCGEASMARDKFGYRVIPATNPRNEICRICHSKHHIPQHVPGYKFDILQSSLGV